LLVKDNLNVKYLQCPENKTVHLAKHNYTAAIVFSVQFYGCMPYKDNFACCKDESVDSTNPTMYRHISVDTDKNIIFFCDKKMYQVRFQSLFSLKKVTNDYKAKYWDGLHISSQHAFIKSLLGSEQVVLKT
jgi:hypothetical protein